MDACLEINQSGPRMKILVTLPSGASAGAEFVLDGPEVREIVAITVEDWPKHGCHRGKTGLPFLQLSGRLQENTGTIPKHDRRKSISTAAEHLPNLGCHIGQPSPTVLDRARDHHAIALTNDNVQTTIAQDAIPPNRI